MSLTVPGGALRIRALHVLEAADDLRLHASTLSSSIVGNICLAVHVEPRFVRLPEIADLPWVWTPDHCLFSRIAGACFSKRGLSPQQAVVADQEAVLRSLVTSGVGLTVMIEDEAVEAYRSGVVALWPESVGTVPLSFAYPARRSGDPLVQAVLYCLGKIWDVSGE